MVSFKKGVKVFGIRPEATLAIQVAALVFHSYGYPCVVTSVVDGSHSLTSLHYSGAAVDLRIRHIQVAAQVREIVGHLKESLTDEYDVVLEETHIHIEFQPKRSV